MSIPATQMRPGMIIKHKDQLHLVFKVEHRTPGNLRAFIQAKLRNLRTGGMFEHRFRSADSIEKVMVDEVSMEFLYADGDDYYFMNPVDYEQTVLKGSTLGDAVEYLTANLQIKVSYHDGNAVGIAALAAFVKRLVVAIQAHIALTVIDDEQVAEAAQPIGIHHATGGNSPDGLVGRYAQEPTGPGHCALGSARTEFVSHFTFDRQSELAFERLERDAVRLGFR